MTPPASKAWTLYHHRKLGIIELNIRGPASAEEILEGSAARIELAERESVADFLLDVIDFTAEKATAEVIFDMVTTKYPTQHIDPNSRFAVVPPTSEDALWFADFYESLCKAHDLAIRRFSDRDTAIDWLITAAEDSADNPE